MIVLEVRSLRRSSEFLSLPLPLLGDAVLVFVLHGTLSTFQQVRWFT